MTPVEFILTFAIGGLSLRAAIGWLKEKTKVKGFWILMITFAACLVASAVYIVAAPIFGLAVAGWDMFLFLVLEVFAGTQLWYRLTK